MLPFNSIINEIIRSEIDIIYTNAFGVLYEIKIIQYHSVTIFYACYMPLLSHIHFVAGPLR
ncbi:hypothetical protein SeSPB_A1646 [Salmonella enterica subsp. enterica serovar Saintpaul str. SARA29]|nr:hypothetical protein SeSPB_A1646 [Salmonella enterica subsp. enterica serovar Saintpaul str. SARA29]